jgi:peptidoglycan/xylan/chitin deacetylase (PgdA/CDA1 family)
MLCRLLLADVESLPSEIRFLGANNAARYADARRFVETMKSWQDDRRFELLKTLQELDPEPAYEPWMLDKYQIMGRQDVRNLPPNIEIGSHTRTHPILPTIDDARATDEIENSRQALEELAGRPVTCFCYPNGQFSRRDQRIVGGAYEVAVTVEERLADRRDDRFRLPRIPAAHSTLDLAIRMIRPGAGEASPDPTPGASLQPSGGP